MVECPGCKEEVSPAYMCQGCRMGCTPALLTCPECGHIFSGG